MARIQLNKVGYTGGHPEHPREASGLVLVIGDDGIACRRFGTLFTISWDAMTSLDVMGPEQAEKRYTATRFVTLGVFALAAKKTTSSAFLHVTTGGFEVGFQIPKTSAGELRSQLARWTTHIPTAGDETSPRPSPVKAEHPQPRPVISVADELAKLAQLRNDGVLTHAQFEAQKTRLLNE